MSSVENITGMDELKDLQRRVNHESIKYQFRPKLIGGLNEEDVSQYIEHIEDKFRKLEQENKKYIDENYALKKKFEMQDEEFRNLQGSMESGKHKLNFYITECKNKDIIINTLNETNSSENIKLQNIIVQMTEDREELEGLLTESKQQISQLIEYSEDLENNINNMKLKKSGLEEENLMNVQRLQNEINQIAKERNELVSELDKTKKYAASLVGSSNAMKVRMSKLEEENIKTVRLQNEINQMAEKRIELETLLSNSVSEFDETKKYAAGLTESNNVMKAKIEDLEKNVLSGKTVKDELNKVCQELKQQLEIEKAKSEKQSMFLEMSKQKITSLESTISATISELDEQRKISEKAEQELQLEKAKVSSNKLNGFKEELDSIYRKIEILEDEAEQHVNNINELQQHLSQEQSRANKAENNLATYTKLVYSLKEKLSNEQNMLETQLRHLLENSNQLQVEISGCLLNLD